MTNGILAKGAVQPSAAAGFRVCEGIQFDADVYTPEDEHMEAIKQNILRKLAARSKVFRQTSVGHTTTS